MVRFQTKEHREAVEFLCKQYAGIDTEVFPRKKGETMPDIICPNFDIEVETLIKGNIKLKLDRYNKQRKRKMVIVIPKYLLEYFDSFEIFKS